jgi:putative CocE/NonD family hydrolase
MKGHMAAYFREQMYGEPIPPAPVVQYYVMGAVDEPGSPGNEWRGAADWPVPAAMTRLYLMPGGTLSSDEAVAAAPAGEMDVLADPDRPADSGTGSPSFPGARDARPFEASGAPGSVLTFSTGVLTKAVEWTGALRARFFVRVGAGSADASFVARVSDVYPDGRSILIADYKRNVSLRAGLNGPPLPLPPPGGEAAELDFRIGWLSQSFNSGHRIRVTVACTGGPLHETWNASHGVRATHQLCHGAGQASHVLAPVVPADGRGCFEVGRADLADLAAGVFPA